MISRDSRNIEWISEAAARHGFKDIGIVEKTIRAFSLPDHSATSFLYYIFQKSPQNGTTTIHVVQQIII